MKTKGNVIVEEIAIGDIHYEFSYGRSNKVEVISLPCKHDNRYWSWTSKDIESGEIIEYGITENHEHSGPTLYTYETYQFVPTKKQ